MSSIYNLMRHTEKFWVRYPNPTSDGWWVLHPELLEMQYYIYILDGRVVMQHDMQGRRTWIPAGELKTGMYSVAFYADGQFIRAQTVLLHR